MKQLEPRPGERMLEAGCGNGAFAGHLAQLGLHLVAFDQADELIRAARARSGPGIDYRVIDATDRNQLRTLATEAFDGAVANMVLMDMPEVGPLYEAVSQILRAGGRFVFSIIHPCFGYGPEPAAPPEKANTIRTRVVARSLGVAERLTAWVPPSVRMRVVERVGAMSAGRASLHYLDPRQIRAQVAPDQPIAHWYFHRPVSELLRPAFEAGLVLDGIAEPRFWDRVTGQPALLACRLRKPPATEFGAACLGAMVSRC